MGLAGFILAMAFLASVPKSDSQVAKTECDPEEIFSGDNMTEEQWRMFYDAMK